LHGRTRQAGRPWCLPSQPVGGMSAPPTRHASPAMRRRPSGEHPSSAGASPAELRRRASGRASPSPQGLGISSPVLRQSPPSPMGGASGSRVGSRSPAPRGPWCAGESHQGGLEQRRSRMDLLADDPDDARPPFVLPSAPALPKRSPSPSRSPTGRPPLAGASQPALGHLPCGQGAAAVAPTGYPSREWQESLNSLKREYVEALGSIEARVGERLASLRTNLEAYESYDLPPSYPPSDVDSLASRGQDLGEAEVVETDPECNC